MFDRLLLKLQKAVKKGSSVTELYAGAGAIGLSVAATRQCKYAACRAGLYLSGCLVGALDGSCTVNFSLRLASARFSSPGSGQVGAAVDWVVACQEGTYYGSPGVFLLLLFPECSR